MPFLPGKTSRGPSRLAQQMAQEHRKFCASHNWFASRDKNKWATQFQVLVNKMPPGYVQTVMEWYHQNHPDKCRLKIKNGREFKQLFETLQRLMEKDDKTKVEISPTALAVYNELKGKGWPKGHEQLPAAIQVTLDSFYAFKAKVATAKSSFGKFVQPYLGSPDGFARARFTALFNSVRSWADWSGIIRGWDGDPSDPQFRQYGHGLAQSLAGDAKQWDALMKEIQ